jgi:HTH-type transcriptional regulator/antitoxin HigA
MIKRQWIEGSTNAEVLEGTVCKFLGISTLDEVPQRIAHAARKATAYDSSSPAQIAWLCRVAQLAPAVSITTPYSASRFPELVARLRALAGNLPDTRRVARLLADFGIRFLIVEPLPSSKIDGVCFWMDRNQPVVALSLRYGKLNNFWHTLLHEIAHVKNGDGNAIVDTDLDVEDDDLPPVEKAANRFAVDTLIPADELESFINRVGPTYSLARIHGFAARIGVHPAIVIGQLAHNRQITWSRFGTHLPNVRENVTATTLTDGWGHAVPAISMD